MLSEPAANAAAFAVCRLLDGGRLEIYSAAGRRLVNLPLADPAFSPASNGKARLMGHPTGHADADGKAFRYQAVASNNTLIFFGEVGQGLQLDRVEIEAGQPVSVEALTFKLG